MKESLLERPERIDAYVANLEKYLSSKHNEEQLATHIQFQAEVAVNWGDMVPRVNTLQVLTKSYPPHS